MGRRMRMGVAIVTVAAGAGIGVGATAHADEEEHCVVWVEGTSSEGELLLSEEQCYGDYEEAMLAEGVGDSLASSTFTIGQHYEGFNFTGSSISVVGSNCFGGWLNLSSNWNNRISSTKNGCPRIRHFAGFNLTGASEYTVNLGGNLGPLNNKTSSIQYLQ